MLKKLLRELTNPRVYSEDAARQEYLTRAVFVMVSGGLFIMTIAVLTVTYGSGDPHHESAIAMGIMDLLVLVGWLLILGGNWRFSSYLLPALFLVLAGYLISTVGPVTTAVLQLAIAVLLAGMLSGSATRWITVGMSMLVFIGAGLASGERDIELFITSGIMLFVSLGGIALLETFYSNLLSSSLENVRERETKMQSIFRAAPVGIGMTVNRVIQEANQRLCQMTGYERDDLVGSNARIFYLSDEEYQRVGDEKYRQIAEQAVGTVETRWLRKDGEMRHILLSSVLLDSNNLTQQVTFSALDITERKEAEERLQELLREKEILLAEVHHRVKNNMQIISSLLSLQVREIENEHLRAAFEESRNRINSMALVHEQLYRAREYAQIEFSEYIDQLTSTLFNLYKVEPGQIQLQVEAEGVFLNLEKALPCGLLLNELITNSLKYAFPNGKKGKIWIKLVPDTNKMFLTFGDNGVGVPEDFDFETVQSLGLQLVNLLAVHDLQGSVAVKRRNGMQFRIEFPVESGSED